MNLNLELLGILLLLELHAFLYLIQRPSARQQILVELSDVERIPFFLFQLLPEFSEVSFANLVSHGLSRPGDVAVNLGGDVGLAQSGVVSQVVHGTLE